jgi:hypothetical protein
MNALKWFKIAVRIGLGMIFLYAATSKGLTSDPKSNPSTLFAEWSNFGAGRLILIGIELILGLWLFSGAKTSMAGIMTLAMVSAFSGLIILEIGRPHPKPCGCMGTNSVASSTEVVRSSLFFDLARNSLIMVCGGWLYLSSRKRDYRTESA